MIAHHSPHATHHRRGATLTEVLMSIMVMGIGVVTLATLFPIAVLRTVRANQLTNGAILRYNAEAFLNTYPHLLHDPDNDADYYTTAPNGQNVQEHYDEDLNGDGTLQAATEDFPDQANGNGDLDRGVYIVDPLGYYTFLESGNALHDAFGNNGATPPVRFETQNNNIIIPRFNGVNDGTSNANSLQTQLNPIPFITGGANPTLRKWSAARWFTQPDSWQDVADDVPALAQTSPMTSIDFPESDLSTVNPTGASAPEYRVTLFDTSGRGSLTRRVSAVDVANRIVFWDERDADGNGSFDPYEDFNGNGTQDQYPLPPGFLVERARLEAREWRFSWLLTVRKGTSLDNGLASADIVVFFRRAFSEEDEIVYQALFQRGNAGNTLAGWDGQPGEAGVDDDGDGAADGGDPQEYGTPGTDDLRTAWVFWTSGGRVPPLKKGEFIFDAGRGHWYRIQDYEVGRPRANNLPALPGTTDSWAALLLDRDLRANSSRGALLMQNVVDVYSLSPREVDPQHRQR